MKATFDLHKMEQNCKCGITVRANIIAIVFAIAHYRLSLIRLHISSFLQPAGWILSCEVRSRKDIEAVVRNYPSRSSREPRHCSTSSVGGNSYSVQHFA